MDTLLIAVNVTMTQRTDYTQCNDKIVYMPTKNKCHRDYPYIFKVPKRLLSISILVITLQCRLHGNVMAMKHFYSAHCAIVTCAV